ncbi:hypothetical protein DPMN_122892 [Dreissena polymorpha]|uniref:Uncharacterized protein n=1 Tax=Dreissena polymorpha TaxID=45954 RepID=A0A9D4GWD5_DREPO|nr:hypothetical protein DPMN_122892 [Dreissena polymorpha]
MPPRAKRRQAEVAQALQATGAEPRQRAVRAKPIVTAPEIDPEESSEPGTSEQQREKVGSAAFIAFCLSKVMFSKTDSNSLVFACQGWRVFIAAVWRKDNFLWPWSFLA